MGIDEEYWSNDFYHHWEVTNLCDKEIKEVYRVLVREIKKGDKSEYWGWWDNESNKFEFVYLHRDILGMCFPYGLDAEIKHGKGIDINVYIEELELLIVVNSKIINRISLNK